MVDWSMEELTATRRMTSLDIRLTGASIGHERRSQGELDAWELMAGVTPPLTSRCEGKCRLATGEFMASDRERTSNYMLTAKSKFQEGRCWYS